MTDDVIQLQLNDPKVQEMLQKGIKNLSDILTMKSAQQSAFNEALKGLSEETDLPKKLVRQLAKSYHRQTFNTEVEEHETFQEVYSKVFPED